MITREFTSTNPSGLHTRPANELIKVAKPFSSTVMIQKGQMKVDAKSLLRLMKANIKQGDTFVISCEGEDEGAAMAAIAACLASFHD